MCAHKTYTCVRNDFTVENSFWASVNLAQNESFAPPPPALLLKNRRLEVWKRREPAPEPRHRFASCVRAGGAQLRDNVRAIVSLNHGLVNRICLAVLSRSVLGEAMRSSLGVVLSYMSFNWLWHTRRIRNFFGESLLILLALWMFCGCLRCWLRQVSMCQPAKNGHATFASHGLLIVFSGCLVQRTF